MIIILNHLFTRALSSSCESLIDLLNWLESALSPAIGFTCELLDLDLYDPYLDFASTTSSVLLEPLVGEGT